MGRGGTGVPLRVLARPDARAIICCSCINGIGSDGPTYGNTEKAHTEAIEVAFVPVTDTILSPGRHRHAVFKDFHYPLHPQVEFPHISHVFSTLAATHDLTVRANPDSSLSAQKGNPLANCLFGCCAMYYEVQFALSFAGGRKVAMLHLINPGMMRGGGLMGQKNRTNWFETFARQLEVGLNRAGLLDAGQAPMSPYGPGRDRDSVRRYLHQPLQRPVASTPSFPEALHEMHSLFGPSGGPIGSG